MKRFKSNALRNWWLGDRRDHAASSSSTSARRRNLARSIGRSGRRLAENRRVHVEKLEARDLLAVVSGEVYIDTNQDGLRQAGEVGAADVRVYVDQNTNGRLDVTETSTRTDADGFYSFPSVAAGNHEVRLAPSPGFVQTAPALTFGWNDTVVEDSNGEFFRAAQLFQVDLDGNVESIGQPTRNRMDGLVRVRDDSLIGIDTRSNEVFNVNPYSGERIRIAESNLDLVGGLAYDRVGNTVYTLVRGSTGSSTRTLARLDVNTGQATAIGGGYEGLNNVTDLIFDVSNRRVVGFDNNDDEFFAFDLNGAGRTLGRSVVTTIDADTGRSVETGHIDADSMALATSEQLVDVLPGEPVATSTYVWMFDADDNNRTSTLLVEIPDSLPNVVETAIVMSSINVSEPVRPVALTRSAVGNNPRNVSLSPFESLGGVNFGIAPDVIGFRVTPSNPLTGPGALSQSGVTVVGGAIGSDFVEITLNREPTSDVILDLNLASDLGGEPGVVLDVNRLTFTPDDWEVPRRVMLSPDPNNLVAVITPSVLTVTVDAPNSDVAWRNLADQTLPVRALPEVNPEQFTTPVISEILVEGWASFDVNDSTDQYIELRGQPNEVLPAGTYFVVIEEASSRLGQVNTVIDLSGQSFGSNGFLVLLQAGHTYTPAFGANVLVSDESGFNGLPGGIFSSSQANGTIDTLFSNSSYFLVQSDAAPVVGLDIDSNNDGFIDPTSPAVNWNTYDAVAMHDFSFYDASYAPIVFIESFSNHHRSVTTNSRGQTIVLSDGFGYVGRIGDSIGSDETDWVYGAMQDVEPGFWGGESDPSGLFEFHEEHVSYPALFDHALDHIGESNFVGGVRGQITLLPSAGDILDGISADTRLPAEGVTVFVDTNGNGVRDDIVKLIEPNELVQSFDANNPLPLDSEFPLTQEFDGVTISWDRLNGAFVTDDIVSSRQRISGSVVGNRIFSAGPFDTFFSSNDTLRFDFFQPIRSASIDVINWSSSEFSTVYGRLDAYNADGELVATSLSSGVTGTRRSTVTVSAPGEQIVRLQAYGENTSVSFDTLRYVQPEAAAVTDENGIYEISGLFPGSYELAVSGTVEVANLLTEATIPFDISKYDNYFFESEFRPNTVPTMPGGADVLFTIDENPAVGTVIATVDAFDADNAGLTYEFIGGDSTGLELVPLPDFTAEIRVADGAQLNFEAEQERILLVRASDSLGASVTARVTLRLRDINEPPVAPNNELAVPEGAIAGSVTGTVIGRIDAVDPDANSNQQLTYTIIPSTPEDPFERDASPYFSVHETSGVVRLIAPLDFETTDFLVLRVQVDDNNSVVGQTRGIAVVEKIIRISDENDAPQIVNKSFTVAESATGELFTLEVNDPDQGQSHRFTLLEPHPALEVTSAGKVVLKTGKTLDFETAPQIVLTVSVSDNGSPALATTEIVTINVEDVNEPAVLSRTDNQNSPTSENQAGVLITTLSLIDPEGSHSDYAFDMLPGPSSELFVFTPETGELRLADGVALDYEMAPVHELTFEIFDSTGELATTTQTFRVLVNNINEPAYVITDRIFVSEVPRPGDRVGRIRVADPDRGIPGTQLSIQLIGGTAQPFFEFESAANTPEKPLSQIDPFLLKVRSDFDFAAFRAIDPSLLKLQVSVSDGNSSTTEPIDVKIELNDVNEPPVLNANALASIFGSRRITIGSKFEIQIPENIAVDPEGESFLLRIGKRVRDANGDFVLDEDQKVKLELPSWLSFNPETRILTGRPGAGVANEDLELTVRALEFGPFRLSDDFDFQLTVSALTNPNRTFDVNDDGVTSAVDALRIINFLVKNGGQTASLDSLSDSPVYLDVSGDGLVTSLDALQVINELNRSAGSSTAPTSEPIESSDLEFSGIADRDGTWLNEDQRRREDAIDRVLGDSNLF